MTIYHNFIGIDIGKFSFVVSIHGQKTTSEYENSSAGIGQFFEEYQEFLPNSLTILETTGGYELALLYSLCEKQYLVHRADTRKVKAFIRSYGSGVKTDALDAKALALYGRERNDTLPIFQPQSQQDIQLFQLVQRRNDLKQVLVAEKNRLQSPASRLIAKSCKAMIALLDKQIKLITEEVKGIIENDPILRQKHKVLKTVPGIGDIVAFELLILLPELGQLDRRKIASLVGVAPRANDSGRHQGYRRTGHGRAGVKPILFLAAMAARNSKTNLKEFYEKLIARGKKKMVALTALMRKIIVIANARLKNFTPTLKHS
jgi:transposase